MIPVLRSLFPHPLLFGCVGIKLLLIRLDVSINTIREKSCIDILEKHKDIYSGESGSAFTSEEVVRLPVVVFQGQRPCRNFNCLIPPTHHNTARLTYSYS